MVPIGGPSSPRESTRSAALCKGLDTALRCTGRPHVESALCSESVFCDQDAMERRERA